MGNQYLFTDNNILNEASVDLPQSLVNETSEWRVSGQLRGSWCVNTVCCVINSSDDVVYGMWDEQHTVTLQVYTLSLPH